MKTVKIGYARVSTNEIRQGLGLEVQEKALKKERCFKIFRETESGTKDDRPLFIEAIELAKQKASEDNTTVKFVVYKLDRLARKVSRATGVIDELNSAGVHVICLKEGIDTGTMMGLVQCQMMSVFSELEVHQLRQRTKDALAQLKSDGKVLGRPKLDERLEKMVCQLYSNPNYSIEGIIEATGVSRSSLYRIVRRHRLKKRQRD